MKRVLLLAIAIGLIAAPTASASSGAISQATVDPTTVLGQFAASVTWDECTPGVCTLWQPFVTIQPATSEYRCRGDEALDSDPNTTVVARSAYGQPVNGTVAMSATDVRIPLGTAAQRVCLIVHSLLKNGDITYSVLDQRSLEFKVPDPDPEPVPPSMTKGEATIIAKDKLAKKYGKSWKKGRAKKVSCTELTTIFNCKASWVYKSKKRKGSVPVPK